MTYRNAYRALGGKRKVDAMAKRIASKRGMGVWIGPQINEEDPSDNWLNAVFTFNGSDQRQCIGYGKAVDDVCREFEKRGLTLQYECNGDAEDGIAMSYRTIADVP